jgi:AraC family transcriptional regulator
MRLYDEWKQLDVLSSLAIEGLVLEVLAHMIRHLVPSLGSRPPRWLKEAIDLLHAEFTEPLSLEYVARAVGVHPVYLARVFRQRHQCTVGEYIRRLRIEYACRQLATSDTPLTDIAMAAGFADPSHFSKVFRRIMGLSPAAFRNGCSAAPRIEKIPVHPEP